MGTELIVGRGTVTKREAPAARKAIPPAKGTKPPHQRPQRPKPPPTRTDYDALVARVAALEAKQPKG